MHSCKLTAYLAVGALFSFLFSSDVFSFQSQASLKKRPCNYNLQTNYHLRCYRFYVPIFSANSSQSAYFQLPVTVIGQAKRQTKSSIIYLPGGPGEGFQTEARYVESWLSRIKSAGITQDVVLFEPRGVGRGAPTWDCEQYDAISRWAIGENLSLHDEYKKINPILEKCLLLFDKHIRSMASGQDTKRVGAGLASFAVEYLAQDVVDLLQALGYQRWNLFGVSYGTRLALALADRPETRALLLDSPYPFENSGVHNQLYRMSNIISLYTKLYKAIAKDNPRNEWAKYANFVNLFESVKAHLRQYPQSYRLENWNKEGDYLNFVLNEQRLLSILFYALYDEALYVSVIRGLHKLLVNKPQALQILLESYVTSGFSERYNSMVYFSAECVDTINISESKFLTELGKARFIKQDLSLEWQFDICRSSIFLKAIEASGSSSALEKYGIQARRITKPTLIISGEYDPVTPVRWARELAAGIKNSQHFIFKTMTHGIVASNTCNLSFISQFFSGKDKIKQNHRIRKPECETHLFAAQREGLWH